MKIKIRWILRMRAGYASYARPEMDMRYRDNKKSQTGRVSCRVGHKMLNDRQFTAHYYSRNASSAE